MLFELLAKLAIRFIGTSRWKESFSIQHSSVHFRAADGSSVSVSIEVESAVAVDSSSSITIVDVSNGIEEFGSAVVVSVKIAGSVSEEVSVVEVCSIVVNDSVVVIGSVVMLISDSSRHLSMVFETPPLTFVLIELMQFWKIKGEPSVIGLKFDSTVAGK